ncbi:flavin-containing monooxygenase [Streptomyces sp. NPDC058440]|uniref:flavin-containing monooxygenase n=1 Tax=Streptomyces sp. NPDC058440 TaxID=3346501 RepID=UPI00364BD18B
METIDAAVVGGGQSGLAAAHELRKRGLQPVVLEVSERAVGSWPRYYDSLTLFSPAGYSSLPGMPFGGDPDRYPHRDEVINYLARYGDHLDAEIRTNTAVESIERDGNGGFILRTADGLTLNAAGVVAASGTFRNPVLPNLPGQETFTGQVLHVVDYRNPAPFTGKRVVVVGGGNSAVQVAYELGEVARTTLATRAPIQFWPQIKGGKDLHHWLKASGFDTLPGPWLKPALSGTPVIDAGRYQQSLATGRMDRRQMFSALDGDCVVWADGTREKTDAVLLATGYRPNLPYLAKLDALDADGVPLHAGGISTVVPGLVYTGLELQRSFSSNTLRGVGKDAAHVSGPLAAHVRKATAAVGL